ncbi:hypothetical protein D3C75_1229790 [compost metagenome]
MSALFLAKILEHHGVGPAEPMRGNIFAVWPHDRGLTRKTRHMATLASDTVKAVRALLPLVIRALDRHAAEGMRDVVAGATKVRARV